MKVVTPEGYTFVTKFQEDNSHKVLRSVDFFSIKLDEIFFDTVCWVMNISTIFFSYPFSECQFSDPFLLIRRKKFSDIYKALRFLMFKVDLYTYIF